MNSNNPELWDNFWKNNEMRQDDLDAVKYESYTIRWQRIEKIILNKFGMFEGLNVLEIGGGIGTNSALMAKLGANVSILDYSTKALERSEKLFNNLGLKVNLVKNDALFLNSKYHNNFDITMSFGLAEHFIGEDRINIISAHIKPLKEGGLSFISVPNKYNPPYRIYKYLAQKMDFWSVGEEYPYSRSELRKICNMLKLPNYYFVGDSFYWSLNFINPVKILKKLLKKKYNYYSTKKEHGSFLDQYISYAIVLVCRK
ncbi:MAG: class I SAM-dependent methyltransferase [Candidatus Scalindua sp.]